MFTKLSDFDLERDYAAPYTTSRNTYLKAAAALKLATGPYKAALTRGHGIEQAVPVWSLWTQVDDGTSLAGIPEIKESAACITV
jgi:hypothetical protein